MRTCNLISRADAVREALRLYRDARETVRKCREAEDDFGTLAFEGQKEAFRWMVMVLMALPAAAREGGHLMDYDKLIDAVKLCGSTPKIDQCKQCAYWSDGDMGKCIPKMTADAATALSTIQAENERLRAELEYEKEHANAYYEECGQWEAENKKLRAELEKVKAERDAAVERIREWEKFDTYLFIHNFITPEKWCGQKED